MSVDPLYSHPQDVAHRQPALITELRRGLDEGTLHVPDVAAGVGRLHVAVDELRHARLQRARTDVVGGNQSIAGRLDEGPLGGVEKSRFVFARAAGLSAGLSDSCAQPATPTAAKGTRPRLLNS